MSNADNPYQAPNSDHEADSSGVLLRPVGSGVRFLNYLVDSIACFVVQTMVGIVIAMTSSPGAGEAMGQVLAFFLNILVMVIYYLIMEMSFQRTLGKMVTGTKVVNDAGGKPTAGQILLRTVCRLIPFEPFSCFGNPSRGWHDSLSKTQVVKR